MPADSAYSQSKHIEEILKRRRAMGLSVQGSPDTLSNDAKKKEPPQ
jgi:hypothetical protein